MSAEDKQPPPACGNANSRCKLEIKRVRRVLRQPLATGNGQTIATRESVLVRIVNLATGLVGYGEAAPLPWFGTETADDAFRALALAAANMHSKCGEASQTQQEQQERNENTRAGANAGDISVCGLGPVTDSLLAAVHASSPCAHWALQCALYQAAVTSPLPQQAEPLRPHPAAPVKLPIAALLQIPLASGGITGHTSGKPDTHQQTGAAERLRPLLAAGHTTFKLKIGVQPFATESAFVGAAAKLLLEVATAAQRSGQAAPKLRLDANGSLNAQTLSQWLSLLAPFAAVTDFIEQPFAAGQEAATAAAFCASPVTYALDESLTSLPRLEQIAATFPQAVLVIKPSLLGDLRGFVNWRAKAENRSRKIIYSTALETGIGLHHALRLAAADPLPPQAAGFGTGSLFTQDDGLGAPPCGAFIAVPAFAFNHPAADPATTAQMEAIWTQA